METKKEPLVSIIIPTFNRQIQLEFAINSVLNQTYQNWELIIIDNNSSDGTEELIANFNNKNITMIKINNNGIIAASRNKGIKEAQGSYIAFLDSDDWWLPNKLKICIKTIQNSESSIDFIYHSLYISKNRSNIWQPRQIFARKVKNPVYDDLIFNGNPIATSSVVVSKELIKKAGLFSENENLIAAEDYDLWLRMSKLSNNFFAIRKPLGYWFFGDNTSSPKLSLTHLKTIKRHHLDSFITKKKCKMPSWWLYHMGRNHYLSRDFNFAKLYLKNILFRRTSLIVKLKTIYMIINIYFKKKNNEYIKP